MTISTSATSTRHGIAACRGIGEALPAGAFFLILEDAKLFLEQAIKRGARVAGVAWRGMRTVLGQSSRRGGRQSVARHRHAWREELARVGLILQRNALRNRF